MVVNYTWNNMTKPVYDLMVNYTFGATWIAGLFLIFFTLAVAYRLKLSADAIVVVLVPELIILSVTLVGINLLPIVVILMAFVIYKAISKWKSAY